MEAKQVRKKCKAICDGGKPCNKDAMLKGLCIIHFIAEANRRRKKTEKLIKKNDFYK
jgi:hypothetical protein